jgi:hypothetical protein
MAAERITLTHPGLDDATCIALSERQARILRKRGWVDALPLEQTDEAEQGDPLGALNPTEPAFEFEPGEVDTPPQED